MFCNPSRYTISAPAPAPASQPRQGLNGLSSGGGGGGGVVLVLSSYVTSIRTTSTTINIQKMVSVTSYTILFCVFLSVSQVKLCNVGGNFIKFSFLADRKQTFPSDGR